MTTTEPTARMRERLLRIAGLTFTAHEAAQRRMEGHRCTAEQWRAFLAVEAGQRYLAGLEPDLARWERD